MRILIPALSPQGQVHAAYSDSQKTLMHRAQAYNAEKYKQIDQELASKIIQQIPNFDIKNEQHQKMLADSRNLPQNIQAFQQAYHRLSIDINFYTLGGESLLARARNHCAQVALTEGYDKIFFIDSDQGFSFEDFYKLLMSPHPISAGVVPLKAFPVPGSFETSLNFMPFMEDEIFFDGSLRTLKSTLRMARAKRSEWIEVAFTGTGFVCVDTSVFAKLAENCQEYIFPNPRSGQPEVHWAFFNEGPINDRYFSEDWALCHRARELGYKIMVNVNARCSHVGPHTFVAG